MTFKSSVNIKFDLGKKEFFERYIPTPSHAEVLRGLLKGFNGTGSKAHIVAGPYGTGKSLIGTLISSIVSKTAEHGTFNVLASKFSQVDDEIYQELYKIRHHERVYLPVILNGYEGPFRQAVLSAIMRVLKENNISVVVPGIVSKILSVIDIWENDYPKTYEVFLKLLRDAGKDVELWRLELLSFNEIEIDWFKTIYPSLTSGAQFILDYEDDFMTQLQYVLKELKKRNIGLFMVYDEFGRFLQNMPIEQIHQTMQDIQDLAEFADHSTDNFYLMYITHKNLRHYFFKYSEEYRSELQRIEKRYVIYHIENDRATYVRLAQNVIHELYSGKRIPENKKKEYIRYLRKFSIFPELNQVEIEELVVKGSYPLHPIALALLPTLSSLFGQNERTLFTFLESYQTGGLMDFVSKSNNAYTAPNLFSYFFPTLEKIEAYEDFNDLNIYHKLIKKIPYLSNEHLDILKLITLWNIAGMQSKHPLTLEFISFALDRQRAEVEDGLSKLDKIKAIRFNSIRGYWELFDGSAFNIEEMIAEKQQQFKLSREKWLQILKDHLVKRFYLANEYNDAKSMTRFASVHLILSSDILNKNDQVFNHDKQADSFVYLVLLECISERKEVISTLLEHGNIYNFYCVPDFEYIQVGKYVDQYEIVNSFLKDTELLKKDPDLKQELMLKREELSFYIRKFLSRYFNFQEKLEWIVLGEKKEIKNEFVLEKILSNMMFEIYPHTPEVRNDSYNRRIVNRVQLKAGYTVVDHIIEHYDKPNFNIAGNGPDYLIYATIFKNNELDISQLNNVQSQDFRLMREKLVTILEEHPSGSLADLVGIFRNPPFGIRDPLIPIYLVGLLRDKWDNLSFYRNDMYVADVNGENLFKMIEEAEEYSYVYYEFGREYEELFKAFEVSFKNYITEDLKTMPQHLKVTNAALRWLRSLPRYTQISSNMEEGLIKLKERIRQIEVNPNQSLEALVKQYGSQLSLLKEHLSLLENFCKQQKEHCKSSIFDILGVFSYDGLVKWADQQAPVYKKQNRLVATILDSTCDNWFDLLVEQFIGVSFEMWSDNTAEMFFTQITNEYDHLNCTENNDSKHVRLSLDGNIKIISKVNLSPKSQTLYQNVYRIIKSGGRTVPQEEIEYLIYELVKEFVK
ncbi:hypothetical protein [Anoxybacteroides rupiense]|uniref:hypothetical protein n=1 Tax=Anoxybacteroides rupiense TaxID=311460 RepID=UPI001F088E9C|nr:hypothetical protein [Anoxybacillus rupiensis]